MTLYSDLLHSLIHAFPNSVSSRDFSKEFNCSERDYLEAFRSLADKNYPVERKHDAFYLRVPMVSEEKLISLTRFLKTDFSYVVKEAVPSTNTFALNHFSSLKEGSVILTHHQTKGKGRLGRQWSSAIGKSVALSIVLSPSINPRSLPLITQLTAAALCKSLKKYGDAKIKWPNDILLNGKKTAGILIESQFQGNQFQGLVIGVGINSNLDSEDFDEALLQKASSIKMETHRVVDPNELIADFLTRFDHYYCEWLETHNSLPFISVCKKESVLLGKEITVFSPNQPSRQAIVKNINEQGELMVQYHDQNVVTPLQSLDFSVRSRNGYS